VLDSPFPHKTVLILVVIFSTFLLIFAVFDPVQWIKLAIHQAIGSNFETTEHWSFLSVEESSLSRTLALDYVHGHTQEEYATREETSANPNK